MDEPKHCTSLTYKGIFVFLFSMAVDSMSGEYKERSMGLRKVTLEAHHICWLGAYDHTVSPDSLVCLQFTCNLLVTNSKVLRDSFFFVISEAELLIVPECSQVKHQKHIRCW
jgi:hypothetical protein